jgi:hypothetical protein
MAPLGPLRKYLHPLALQTYLHFHLGWSSLPHTVGFVLSFEHAHSSHIFHLCRYLIPTVNHSVGE